MKLNLQIIVNISIFPLILGFTPGLVSAQIRPDNSLGNENSLVIPNIRIRGINSDQIKGGAIRGGNLFHSFNEFNITPGRGAYFSNPNGINNIFTRVTGNKISNINGTLGVLGDANLFFMNPNGIIFGNGAKLDLNGSFFATTGNVLNFGNDFNFSARDPQNVPIVVHNFEPGLGFGNKVQVNLNETSGDIVIRGKGHNLNSSSFVANQNSIVGLQLDFKKSNSNLSKNTVGLFASNIFMDGGILKAEAGQIELGAIKKGVIDLNINKNLEWNIDYKKVLNQGNINLTNQSLLDASSPETPIDSVSAGSIKLKGFNITLRDNSLILLANRNYAQPGDIILNASNQLKIEKSTLTDDIAGGIISDSLENGAGGKIIISAPLFFLDNSTVLSRASGTGKGGNIEISTQNLQILNESNIDTAAIRSTEKGGGDIIVKASNAIKVSGISSTIRSYTLGFSNGGNIRINANKVTIENGARIGSNVFATAEARFINSNAIFDGRGGNVEIKANNLEIIGSTSRILRSAIGNSGIISDPSTVDSNTFGNTKAGDLNIIVNKLTIKNGAEIRGATFSSGDAANIKIQASDVLIQNGKISVSSQPADARRRAILRLPEIPAGRTGTLSFQVGRLNLDEATITATSASGFGGTIDISGLQPNSPASIISLNNNSAIETNNNTTTDPTRASIDIFTHDLTLNNGSRISANVSDSAQNPLDPNLNLVGGNINIQASGDIRVLNNSSIAAEVNNRPGGTIDGGNINIQTQGNILLSNNISPRAAISASVDEFGNGGNINITLPNGVLVAVNNADIRANAIDGNGGNIIIEAFSILTTPDIDISASSERGLDGVVEVNSTVNTENFLTVEETDLPSYNQAILSTCKKPNNDEGATFEENQNSPQSLSNRSRSRYRLNSFLSTISRPNVGKTIEDIKMLEPNATIEINGDVYLGKVCLSKIKD